MPSSLHWTSHYVHQPDSGDLATLATEEAEDEDVVPQAVMKMETEQKIQNMSAQAIDTD